MHCLLLFLFGMGPLASWYPSSAIILVSWLFYFNYCTVGVCVLCLFITVHFVCLRSVIVEYPSHTRLLFTYDT